jgi:hypothetical protein
VVPYLYPEWAWKLYVAWRWVVSHTPRIHSKAFWDAHEADLDWVHLHAYKALDAIETLPEGIGSEKARGHLYQILEFLSR